MKVLGVDITASAIQWIILEGDRKSGAAILLRPSKQQLPQSEQDDIGNLLRLKELVQSHLQSSSVDAVAVIKAGNDCSPLRCKIECMVQYAAKTAGVPCHLVAPQTVAAAVKSRFIKETGGTMEDLFFGGNPIYPKYLTKAAYCAWGKLS